MNDIISVLNNCTESKCDQIQTLKEIALSSLSKLSDASETSKIKAVKTGMKRYGSIDNTIKNLSETVQ